MDTVALLYEVQEKALADESFRKELLATKKAESPYKKFCEVCREHGYEIYELELILAGEEFCATAKRSTNGGGENSPRLAGETDFYEMLMADLEKQA